MDFCDCSINVFKGNYAFVKPEQWLVTSNCPTEEKKNTIYCLSVNKKLDLEGFSLGIDVVKEFLRSLTQADSFFLSKIWPAGIIVRVSC